MDSVVSSRLGAWLVLLSGAAFGCMPAFTKWAYSAGANAATLLALRFSLAAFTLLLYQAWKGFAWPNRRTVQQLSIMGIFYVGQAFCYFSAIRRMSSALAVILLYLYPAIVTVLSCLFLKVRLTGKDVTALFLAVIGTILIVDWHPGAPVNWVGFISGIGAAVLYSIYILLGSRLPPAGSSLTNATCVITSAALGFTLLSFVHGPEFPTDSLGWLGALLLALLSTVFAITAFLKGIELVGPVRASILSTADPLVAIFLGFWLFEERLSVSQLAGGTSILTALFLSVLRKR